MKQFVAVSGGKDSVAMALRLKEVEPETDFQYFITPTGDELPEMFEHWRRLETMLGKPLVRLEVYPGKNGLHEIIRDQKMIPNFRARFCTRILKIEPALQYLGKHTPCVHCVGLRADEETRLGIYDQIDGVESRYPLREWGWGIDDVWDYLDAKGITIPERTDCSLCFFQRLVEWKRLSVQHPEMYQAGVDIETEMNATFRSPSRDTWAADLGTLRDQFAKRKVRGEKDHNQRMLFDCDRESLCRVCSM